MLKGRNRNKKRNVSRKVISTPEIKAAQIKREKVGLATRSPTPSPMAARKGDLLAILELWNFKCGGDGKGYATEGSDLISDLDLSVATAFFTIGGNSNEKGKAEEGSEEGRDDGS